MPEGLVLLDKPAGRTSFEALGPVKRSLKTGKVGHAGTLDKFATGLLIVLTGKLTRIIRAFSDLDKRYVARVHFGLETETLDPEGAVTAHGSVPDVDQLRKVAAEFVGIIEQIPPAYSAVHVDGRRAYQRVRNGERVTLDARGVVVYSIEVLEHDPPESVLEIRCGSGTYVRSLARDIAARLGTVAHVTELRRTTIGPFTVDEAVSPDDFVATRDLTGIAAFADRLESLQRVTISDGLAGRVAHGTPVSPADAGAAEFEDGLVLLFSEAGRLAAVTEKTGDRMKYVFVSVEQV
ncbi:MAG: tRNA pseudouridine(55) synthase TruB [Spirochaetes bacterium]|jgi:tRNA pseudouridine55 synthase|nr:tRNA pseudouridine(55) synthase TruB [Spirochaetota bacterium]